MKIGVTGATGQLGQLVVQQLKDKGLEQDVVALVRSTQKAESLGVEARAADYTKPETLNTAFAGIDTLLLISSNEIGQRATQHRNAIEAAKNAGVRRIVYTSLLHADTSPLSLAPEHRETEAALKNSGIPFTILRNGWYTENYADSIDGALAGGAFLGSAGTGKVSSATRADFAAAAVAVLTGTGHEGKIYELAGDDAYTLTDLAAEISRQSGKNIPYKNLPQADYAAMLEQFGVPGTMAQQIAGWDAGVAEGAVFDDGRQLSQLIGRPTTPLAQVVAHTLKSISAKA